MRSGLPTLLRIGQAWLTTRFGSCYRQFFGLRSSYAGSSVASGRIEFVSPRSRERVFSTDYPFTFGCSPRGIAGSQLLWFYWREAPPERDFHPPVQVRSQAHICRCAAASKTHRGAGANCLLGNRRGSAKLRADGGSL